MRRAVLSISYALLSALLLSGCVGVVLATPTECEFFYPHNTVAQAPFWPDIPKWSTKEEFVNDWGKPDRINANSANRETWYYERHLWCGYFPIVAFIPVPLLLPVCDGFDRIEFVGNEANRLHTKRIFMKAYLFIGADSGKGNVDLFCRHPQPPENGAGSGAAEPAMPVAP